MSERETVATNKGVLGAAVANAGTVVLPFRGESRAKWAATDLTTLRVVVGELGSYGYPSVSVTLGTSMTITNNTGVTWPKDAKIEMSAVQPVISIVRMTPDEYAQLPAADPRTLYISSNGVQPRLKTVVVLGSSTGAGYGASVYANSWAGLLETALKAIDPTWQVINVSLAGTHTQNSIDRFFTDVAVYRPSHVILCTGIVNEPLFGSNEPGAHQTYLRNTKRLMALCDMIGAKPILASHFPYNSNNAIRYQLALAGNAQMEMFGVPVIDWMSTLDDGTGKFTGSTTFSADGQHATGAGHAHYFDAIDLSWFWSFADGGFVEPGTGGRELAGSASTIAHAITLTSAANSFALWGRFKSKSGVGTFASIMCANIYGAGNAPLRVRTQATVATLTDSTNDLATSTYDPTTDFNVHEIAMCYNAARNKASLFIDGALIGSEGTPAATVQATNTFGFMSRADAWSGGWVGAAMSRSALWRSPLSAAKIAALRASGRIPAASLSFHGESSGPLGQLAANLAPTEVIPIVGGASGWVQVAGF